MGSRESSTTQAATATLAPPGGLECWRERLRAATYALYRRLERGLVSPSEVETEALVNLIDEGRGEPGAPSTVTHVTAEALGGAIVHELAFAARHRPRPEAELVPHLLFAAVLPYIGEDSAAEELRIPPPPR